MNKLDQSETMRPVTDSLEDDEGYSSAELIVSTALTHVYKIRRADKMLCIKTPAKDSGLMLEMLKREYKIGVGLSHPFIASYLRWETDSPVGPGIVMEYVDGCGLDEFLTDNKSSQMRRRLFEQLLDATEYLHECGIVHNDLKPANILVNRVNRSLKLIDFGFSDDDANAMRRAIGGTAGYASPELMRGAKDADARSDIYSLGILMRYIFGSRYRWISRRCLNPNPSRRYRTVAELRKAWMRARRIPRVVAGVVFAVLLTAMIIWNRSIAVRSAEASANATSRIELLNDSISKLNGEIMDLSGYVDEIHQKEQRHAALVALYNHGADSLATAIAARMRKLANQEELLVELGAYYESFTQYNKKFEEEHPGDGAEIVNTISASVRNKVYDRVKAAYDASYARISGRSQTAGQD